MKAVILEIKKHNAAALDENGIVRKVRNKNYFIGQTIDLSEGSQVSFTKKLQVAAVAVAVVLCISTVAFDSIDRNGGLSAENMNNEQLTVAQSTDTALASRLMDEVEKTISEREDIDVEEYMDNQQKAAHMVEHVVLNVVDWGLSQFDNALAEIFESVLF